MQEHRTAIACCQDLLSDLPLSDIQEVLEENTGTEDLTFPGTGEAA